MNTRLVHTGVAIAAVLVHSIASAAVIRLANDGFEQGNLGGWSAVGDVTVDGIDRPTNGGNFSALLVAGSPGVYTTLSQSIFIGAGDNISGWVRWIGGDYLPFDDDGYVKISAPSIADITLFAANISAYGDFGISNWTQFSFTAPFADTYTLSAGVRNMTDSLNSSSLRLDNTAAVPVPGPLPVIGTIVAFSWSRRLRRTIRSTDIGDDLQC